MAVEQARGCGFRKVGGIYLVSGELSGHCGKLPFPITVCPCCYQGIKPARGWSWVNPRQLFGPTVCGEGANYCIKCPMGPGMPERGGLLWVGDKFYSPASFVAEAALMGVSRRINSVPRDLVVGETVIYMAHRSAIKAKCNCEPELFERGLVALGDRAENCPVHGPEVMGDEPGIIAAFIPRAIEIIVTDLQAQDDEFMAGLEKRGLTPVIVPHNDPDHQPKAKR
jgi:hypothetical protein